MKYTKYETARVIGARALQLAMGAPMLLKMSDDDFRRLRYSPIEIAKAELEKNILPITIRRPLPQKWGIEEAGPTPFENLDKAEETAEKA